MSITKEELHKMIEHLNDDDRTSAYEFLYFLLSRPARRLSWEEIDKLPPDTEPLSKEEKQQIEAMGECIAMEKAIDEYNL